MKDYLYKIKQKTKRFIRDLVVPSHKTTPKFYVQKMPIKKINDRLEFFIGHCKNKDVIHFGCTDWPIFNPKNNLHIQLSKYTKFLDGFDIDTTGIESLKKYVDQNYYSDFRVIPDKIYDVCLVPETIEHVDNVADFLANISKIKSNTFLITAPNCFAKGRSKKNVIKENYMIELVHPDHNCWYSPYTLKNQIEKYGNLKVINIYLLENERMVCCEAIKM